MDPLKVIFRNNYFMIPENQRGYSWRKEHAEALMHDLGLMGDKSHYMGTIIVTSAGDGSDFQDEETRDYTKGFILDDGQQRLTTFLMLIHSLLERFYQIGENTNRHALELESYRIYSHGGKHLRIKNNQADLQQYLNHKLLNAAEPASVTAPMLALKEVLGYLESYVNAFDLDQLIEWKLRVTAQAKFILVNLADENIDRYLAFDAINSRGLPLTEFDKVKNFCALLANRRPGLSDVAPEKSWYKALESLVKYKVTNRKGESTFISEVHAVFFNQRIGSDRIHENFVEQFTELLSSDNAALEAKLISYVKMWETFSEAFGFTIYPGRKSIDPSKATVDANDWLTNIDHMSLPGITRTILCAGIQKYAKAEFETLAKWCEIYTFRVHALAQRRTDKNSQGIIQLAHDILFESKGIQEVGEQLCKWLDEIAPLQGAFRFLSDGGVKYYFDSQMKGWGHSYYFLYQYEISRIHGGASPIDWQDSKERQKSSIEHILPQTHRDEDWWQSHWTDENDAEKYKHRLGNLVLTNDNSALGRKAFPIKLNDPSGSYCYNHNSATNGEKLIINYTNGNDWNKPEVLKRERDLISFALKRWTIECCSDNGTYKLPDEFEDAVDQHEITINFDCCISSEGTEEQDSEEVNESDGMTTQQNTESRNDDDPQI